MNERKNQMATKKQLTEAIRKKRLSMPKPTREEIDTATKGVLEMLIHKLSDFVNYGSMSNFKLKYSETKPLKPLYRGEGGKHVGYIQEGPKVLSVVIEDFTNDGHVKGLGE
jgi:hypothetical protein